MWNFLDKIVFRLYDRTKSCRVNLYHTPFASLRRGFFLGNPVIPLRGTPEGLFFSHIDNLNRVKSVGALLAYAGGVGWPSPACDAAYIYFPIIDAEG